MSTYISVNLGGKERGCKMGIGFLRYLDEEAGIKISQIDDLMQGTNAIVGIPKLLFYSLKFNAKRKGEKFDYTIDDVFDWIDEDGGLANESLQLFIEKFPQSLQIDMGKEKPQAKKGAKK